MNQAELKQMQELNKELNGSASTLGCSWYKGKWTVYRTDSIGVAQIVDTFDDQKEAIGELFKLYINLTNKGSN